MKDFWPIFARSGRLLEVLVRFVVAVRLVLDHSLTMGKIRYCEESEVVIRNDEAIR